MSYVIKTGKTVDEAVSEALKELNITRDEAFIEIIEESSKGFLGFGAKDATVKVSKVESNEDILKEIFNSDTEKSQEIPNEVEFENTKPEVLLDDVDYVDNLNENIDKKEVQYRNPEELAREFLDKIISTLGVDYELKITKEDNILYVDILGDEQKLGIVIGKRGITLDSIQYILSLIINKHSKDYIRVVLDSSGYREKREKTLRDLAAKMAVKVLKNNRSIRLEPMNAHERKIIHEALQDYDGVITHSEGKEPFRKVVIQKERKY